MPEIWELNEEEFFCAIRERVRRIGNQKQAAAKLGVSEQYLCDILTGRRKPGPKIVAAMGFERATYYQRDRPIDLTEDT